MSSTMGWTGRDEPSQGEPVYALTGGAGHVQLGVVHTAGSERMAAGGGQRIAGTGIKAGAPRDRVHAGCCQTVHVWAGGGLVSVCNWAP